MIDIFPENSRYLEEEGIEMNKQIIQDILCCGIILAVLASLIVWVMKEPITRHQIEVRKEWPY